MSSKAYLKSERRRVQVRENTRRYVMKKKGLQYRPPVAKRVDDPRDPNPMGLVQHLDIPVPSIGLKIAVIPDVQAAHGVSSEHLTWAGKYIAEKRPDVIVCIGDFGDFPSLSRFLKPGSEDAEGQHYQRDLDAFHRAMDLLMTPIKKRTGDGWQPHLEYTLGNHEDHIPRYVNEHPVQRGRMGIHELKLADYGWRVHPFLHPVAIGGVAFCHYFPSGVMGQPITSARALLTKLHMSAVAGHQQGRDVAYARRADGGHMTTIITGSFYTHNMAYLSPFTNAHWRGMFFMHETKGGQFDEMWLSTNYLKRRFA